MRSLNWRIGYVACSLIYMAVMIYLAGNNFGMVHREYRRAAQQLQHERIAEIALRELVDQCRKELHSSAGSPAAKNSSAAAGEDPCLSRPAPVLEERQKTVKERLEKKRRGIVGKLILFYLAFGIFFLVLPPVTIYLVLSVFIWIFQSIE